MVDNETVLAHLARWFPSRAENAATDALAYVLNRSAKAREALDDLIRSGVENVASVVRVRTQVVGPDGTRPDLVGEDEDGKERVLVEVKFWADLTDNQPNAYLDRLPDDGPAVLLFLAPDERVKTLWPSLRRRAASADRPELLDVAAERKCMRVGDSGRHLMVTGWTGLLDCMATRVRDAGESGIEADIRQLRGLAEYAEIETAPEAEGRNRYFRRLIDSATARGVDQSWLSTKGLNRTPRTYGYGRYVRFTGSGAVSWFGVNDVRYKKYGETRLWLHFKSVKPKRGRLNQSQFDALRKRCRLQDRNGRGWVPLTVKSDVEPSEILEDVLDQLVRITEVIDNPSSESAP